MHLARNDNGPKARHVDAPRYAGAQNFRATTTRQAGNRDARRSVAPTSKTSALRQRPSSGSSSPAASKMTQNEAGEPRLLYFARHIFKLKIIGAGWGRDPWRVTSCALVVEETAEPGEGATFCAIWPALPILGVCSRPTSLASGLALMVPMMKRTPMSSRRRPRLGRNRGAACASGTEDLPRFARRPRRQGSASRARQTVTSNARSNRREKVVREECRSL